MNTIIDPIINSVESILQWLSVSLKQTTAAYCDLETAIDQATLVARDGSLISVFSLDGIKFIPGPEEFERLHEGICQTFQAVMARPGYNLQVVFSYDKAAIKDEIKHIIQSSWETANRLSLNLDDLFQEKVNFLSQYCSHEQCYLVLWTTPLLLSKQQLKDANKRRMAEVKEQKIPPMRNAQALSAPMTELRDTHESLAKSILTDLNELNLSVRLLDVYTALKEIRYSIDPNFTGKEWTPYLPGDKIPLRANIDKTNNSRDISELMWPSLSSQLIPRDAEIIDLRTARIGDMIYAPIFIDLFPKEIKIFNVLLQRVISTKIPWRISFFTASSSIGNLNIKGTVSSLLSWAGTFNRLISDSKEYLEYIDQNTDDSIVSLRVALVTWAPESEPKLLRSRVAELTKAVQSWGNCDVGEISGDSFGATLTSAVGITKDYISTESIAPLSDVIKMWPITRPASLWQQGAVLLRSPDGKLLPYQPGSSVQTTFIDLVYARPGSGKSVLSNAINFALCLEAGKERLPKIGVIDIGPSSSGLISLLQEALPKNKQYLVAYHRLQMTKDYSINPFDTQLGCRRPMPAERSFLVNFLSLIATPIGSERAYDGVASMAGLIVDELYKTASDEGNPNKYTYGLNDEIDSLLQEINFASDEVTSWWEVTDALFKAGKIHAATLAQRYAVPVLADVNSIVRTPAVEDLYGKITVSTGETIIEAFSRMISAALREYPILASATTFDLGEARVVSLDLDEVAKSGGDAADRQTAVMYMLARYILARDYYLNNESLGVVPNIYMDYHKTRVTELKEDPKRLVLDEFHRTSKAQAVREQVIVDMREGRKWNIQVALLSQSLDDFDSTMVEFATSVFIMDAGPITAIEKTAKTFGLSNAEKLSLRTKVHGPRAGGGTFLAQFATKKGITTQLLTCTLGPSELWAFSTTAQDARVRNELYHRIGASNARRILGHLFPGGSVVPLIEQRLLALKETGELQSDSGRGIIQNIIEDVIKEYQSNPSFSNAGEVI